MLHTIYSHHNSENPSSAESDAIAQFPSLEELSAQLPIELYIELFAPQRRALLERILTQIEFRKFFELGGKLIVDTSLPVNIGGYYTWGSTEKVIAINPMFLLFASETEIAHILVHEGLHAGIYTDGVEMPEEVITETMAKAGMLHYYGYSDLQSGYDDMVTEMAPYFAELTFPELITLIENGTEETFDNYLELVILGPLLDQNDVTGLSFTEVSSVLKARWPMLKRLFPRMLSMIEGRIPAAAAESQMDAGDYKLEGLLQKLATRLAATNKIPPAIFAVLDHANVKSLTEAFTVLQQQGFAYLYDFYPQAVIDAISDYLYQSQPAELAA